MAAAVVQRRLQAQKQAQAQYQQQIIAQQQAAQVAAYQQAVAQRQAQLQQQAAYQKAATEYAAYKQAMQQAVAQRQAELQAAEQGKAMIAQKQAAQVAAYQQAAAYKQTVEMVKYKQAVQAKAEIEAKQQAELNQQIGQYADFLAKRKALIATQTVQAQQAKTAAEMVQYNQYQQARAAQAKAAVESRMMAQQGSQVLGGRIAQEVLASKSAHDAAEKGGTGEQESVVTIQDLWRALDTSSIPWSQIIDREIKVLTVAEYIDRFKRAGITIKNTPGHYVDMIDSVAGGDAGYLDAPFMNVLSYAAIVEYDFENGQNKDELARRVLGEANFQSNKARLEGR